MPLPPSDAVHNDDDNDDNGYGASECGAWSNAVNLFLKLFFVPVFTYDGLVMSREQPQHTTNCRKHGNHGGGAACPSSNKDSINPLDLSCGRPKGGLVEGTGQRNPAVTLKLK
jgi:hypothetical protein